MNTSETANKIASFITQPIFLIALVALVVATYAAIASQRLTLPPVQKNQAVVTDRTPQANKGTNITSAQIMAMNLFGVKIVKAPPEQAHQNIPETKLKLVLKGAFNHSNPDKASALIATDRKKRSERFYIGDKLPGNATLDQVLSNYVVLNRNGRFEKLLFPRAQGGTNSSQSNSKRNNNTAPSVATTNIYSQSTSQSPSARTQEQSKDSAQQPVQQKSSAHPLGTTATSGIDAVPMHLRPVAIISPGIDELEEEFDFEVEEDSEFEPPASLLEIRERLREQQE